MKLMDIIQLTCLHQVFYCVSDLFSNGSCMFVIKFLHNIKGFQELSFHNKCKAIAYEDNLAFF